MAFAVDGIAFDVGNTLILDPFETILRKKALEIKKGLLIRWCIPEKRSRG